VSKSLHPKQDPDPFSRVAEWNHVSDWQTSKIIHRNSPQLMHSMRPRKEIETNKLHCGATKWMGLKNVTSPNSSRPVVTWSRVVAVNSSPTSKSLFAGVRYSLLATELGLALGLGQWPNHLNLTFFKTNSKPLLNASVINAVHYMMSLTRNFIT